MRGRSNPVVSKWTPIFSILTEALIDLGQQTLSRNPTFHLVAGDTLELWMLKVACGMYFSAGAKDGIRIEGHAIDLDKVRRTFFDGEWDRLEFERPTRQFTAIN